MKDRFIWVTDGSSNIMLLSHFLEDTHYIKYDWLDRVDSLLSKGESIIIDKDMFRYFECDKRLKKYTLIIEGVDEPIKQFDIREGTIKALLKGDYITIDNNIIKPTEKGIKFWLNADEPLNEVIKLSMRGMLFIDEGKVYIHEYPKETMKMFKERFIIKKGENRNPMEDYFDELGLMYFVE